MINLYLLELLFNEKSNINISYQSNNSYKTDKINSTLNQY